MSGGLLMELLVTISDFIGGDIKRHQKLITDSGNATQKGRPPDPHEDMKIIINSKINIILI